MTEEHKVDGRGAATRKPAQDVWTTVTKVQRTDPATGKKRSVRIAIVRWRRPDGRTSERRFDDPLAAEVFAKHRRDELHSSSVRTRGGTVPFSEWMDTYLSARCMDYVRWKSGELRYLDSSNYAGLMKAAGETFLRLIGDRPLEEYVATDFERFRSLLSVETSQRGRPRSQATVESYMQRVRTIIRAAEAEGLLTRRIPIQVRQVTYEKPVISQEEIETIFKAAETWPPESFKGKGTGPGRVRPILMTLYYTMLRRGELIHLTWNDIRREDRQIVEIAVQPKEWDENGVRHRWEPKDREIRVVPVHPRLAEVLDTLSRNRANRMWVFTDGTGGRWTESGLASLMRHFGEAHGFNLGFHIWRRTGLTHLHDAAAPVKDIQAIAGHASITTTMKYVRSTAKGQQETIRRLR
jgi:integrase